LPLLEVSAQDLFDAAGELKPIATLRRDLGIAIRSIRLDKTGKVSEAVLADKVAVAGLLLRSIGAVKDGQGTADSIDRLGQRLDRAIGRAWLRRSASAR
jgi:hypothetical protein